MRLAAQMVIGPDESTRYLDRTLRRARSWADEILVIGDRCDRDTWESIQAWATHSHLVDTGGFHESQLRNQALALTDAHLTTGDLVVVLDADEELRTIDGGRDPRAVLWDLAEEPGRRAWPVMFWHLWSPDGDQHRVDGFWHPSVGYRIYRHQPGQRVPDREIACPPIPGMHHDMIDPRLGIAHWGYARPHDRTRKHAYYMHVDGGRYHLLSHLESIITEPTLETVPCS